MGGRKTIAVIYHLRGNFPLRSSAESHLFCWRRYSRHRTVYINAAMSDVRQTLERCRPDSIILHTSFCGVRWQPAELARLRRLFETIAECPATTIALPQDEFYLTQSLQNLLRATETDVILSCADRLSWPAIYGPLSETTTIETVLTGYLDEPVLRAAGKVRRPIHERENFMVYRAWHAEDWLGEHGQHKIGVGRAFEASLSRRGLPCDISLHPGDTITGQRWIRFLSGSRATPGVEGGASMLDPDGSLRTRVMAYRADHPDASFDAVRDTCFPDLDGRFSLKCLSPRHLEACATGTAQALVAGRYNDALQPGEHFLEVQPDYSNLEAVVDALHDVERVQALADRAFRDIAMNERFHYRWLVGHVEATYIDRSHRVHMSAPLSAASTNVVDWLNWRQIEMEALYSRSARLRSKRTSPFTFALRLLKPLYLFLQRCRMNTRRNSNTRQD